jgi:hypothetical protein
MWEALRLKVLPAAIDWWTVWLRKRRFTSWSKDTGWNTQTKLSVLLSTTPRRQTTNPAELRDSASIRQGSLLAPNAACMCCVCVCVCVRACVGGLSRASLPTATWSYLKIIKSSKNPYFGWNQGKVSNITTTKLNTGCDVKRQSCL